MCCTCNTCIFLYAGLRKDFNRRPENKSHKKIALTERRNNPGFSVAVELREISIRYGNTQILDTINWKVLRNEKWALLGENGSGKSTLLSLLNADNPQAYANDMILFDEQRRIGQSIWKMKQRIGFFSPELHAYFNEDLSVFDVIVTGYTDTFIPMKNTSDEWRQHVEDLLDFYGKLPLKDRPYLRLSSGEQRLVLFIRSLVKEVDLLILDEPFQGFDNHLIEQSKMLLDQYCEKATLIFVSHYETEIPGCVDKFLILKNGRIADRYFK
jgi:molybdate transport system ATP-binding protein